MPDGRLVGNALHPALENVKGLKMSQCVQDKIDHIYINMIIDESFSEESSRVLEQGLRSRLGNDINIDFKVVDQLERAKSGKTQFVLSKIGRDYI